MSIKSKTQHNKIIIAAFVLLWLVSAGVSLWQLSNDKIPQAHADVTLSLSATQKVNNQVDLTVTTSGSTADQAKVYGFWRKVSGNNSSNTHVGTSNTPAWNDTFGIKPPAGSENGPFIYTVKAYKNQTDADAEGNGLASADSAPITLTTMSTSTGTGGTATGAVSGAECAEAVQKGRASSNMITTSLYTELNKDGVKKVFKWSLSLVNVIVLMFLLVIAFANIARVQIDNYAIKTMFPTLIGGVLLANFSWLLCRFMIETSTLLYNSLVAPYGGGAGLFTSIAEGYGIGQNTICTTASGSSFASGILGSVVGTVLIAIAAVLMFTLYALLVARIWIITMMVVMAPLACIALALSTTRPYFKKWWSLFFNWTFMTPAAFLILILARQVSDIGGYKNPNLTKYILTTALLYFAIQVPFKMGGDWMRQWGNVVSSFKKKAAQPLVNQQKAIQDWASKGYQTQKDLLKLRGKRIAAGHVGPKDMNINPLRGFRNMISAGRDKREMTTKRLEDEMFDIDNTAQKRWRESRRGERYLQKNTRADSGKTTSEIEKENAQTAASERYYQTHDRERTVTAETRQQTLKDALEATKQERANEFLNTDAGKALFRDLASAGYRKETAANVVAALQASSARDFMKTADGIALVQKLIASGWKKEAAELWLKKTQDDIAWNFAGRNDAHDPNKEDTPSQRVGAALARDLTKARAEGNIADLRVKRAFIRAETRAREDYIWDLANGKIKDADPEEVKDAKKVIAARDNMTKLKGERDAMHKQIEDKQKTIKPEIDVLETKIEQLEGEREEEIAKRTAKAEIDIRAANPKLDDHAISKLIRKRRIRETYLDELEKTADGEDKVVALRKEIKNKKDNVEGVGELKKQIVNKSGEIKKATITLDKLDQKIVRHSYEAQEAAITADDELVETSSRRVAMLAQSEVGHAIDARRAVYRQHIATFQAMADQYAQSAIANLRMNPAWIAKYTSTNFMTGKPHDRNAGYGEAQVYARNADDVIEMRDRHYTTQVKLATAKANAEAEHRKGVEKANIEMISSQMINDRIEIAEATVKKLSNKYRKIQDSIKQYQTHYDELLAQRIRIKNGEETAVEGLDEEIEAVASQIKQYQEKNLTPIKKLLESAEENLDNQNAQLEEHAQKVFKKTGGDLDLLGEHQRSYYAQVKDKSGKVIGLRVRHARKDPELAASKQRKEIDRGIGEARAALKQGSSIYSESFSPDAILNELRGEGIDIHNIPADDIFGGEAVQELLRGNVEHGISMIKDEARDWRKIVSCIDAAINMMQRTTSGGNNTIRVACIGELFPDELMSDIIYSLADFDPFKAIGANKSGGGDSQKVNAIVDMGQSGKLDIDAARQLLNSFQTDAPNRLLVNVVKDQPIFGRLVALLSSSAG